MKENMALYSKINSFNVSVGDGNAKNLYVWTDLELKWQKDECLLKDQQEVW